MMFIKTLAEFNKLTVLGLILLGILVVPKWETGADSSNPYRVAVVQDQTQTPTSEKNTSSSEGKEPESKTDEKKKSTGDKEKPLKDFKPSERIEAEQAVDFPYDI